MSPYAAFNRVNLDQGYLPLVERLMAVVAACQARGARYECTSLYRTFGQQKQDWCKGRTTPGAVVTDAGPGESPHNFGLAADFACLAPDGSISWQQSAYDALVEEGERAGLVSGRRFARVDSCHLNWPGYVTGTELAPLKSVYLKHPDAPLSAVFEYLDSRTPKT